MKTKDLVVGEAYAVSNSHDGVARLTCSKAVILSLRYKGSFYRDYSRLSFFGIAVGVESYYAKGAWRPEVFRPQAFRMPWSEYEAIATARRTAQAENAAIAKANRELYTQRNARIKELMTTLFGEPVAQQFYVKNYTPARLVTVDSESLLESLEFFAAHAEL